GRNQTVVQHRRDIRPHHGVAGEFETTETTFPGSEFTVVERVIVSRRCQHTILPRHQAIELISSVSQGNVAGHQPTTQDVFCPNAGAAQGLVCSWQKISNHPAFDSAEMLLCARWSIQTTNVLPVVFTQSSFCQRRQTVGTVVCLMALHCRG